MAMASKEKSGGKEKPGGKEKASEKAPETTDNSAEFLQKAAVADLLEVVRNTGLSGEHLVKNYEGLAAPEYEDKEAKLRLLIHRHRKRHADFRHRFASLVKQRSGQK
jgi:hypothetical protein